MAKHQLFKIIHNLTPEQVDLLNKADKSLIKKINKYFAKTRGISPNQVGVINVLWIASRILYLHNYSTFSIIIDHYEKEYTKDVKILYHNIKLTEQNFDLNQPTKNHIIDKNNDDILELKQKHDISCVKLLVGRYYKQQIDKFEKCKYEFNNF